jgi:hypothetical protein
MWNLAGAGDKEQRLPQAAPRRMAVDIKVRTKEL